MTPRPFTAERLEALFLSRRDLPTFWRHDVDASLPSAMRMAALEQELGVSATYYLMVDSPFYWAADSLRAAVVLTAMGHRVGAHVDERLDGPDTEHRYVLGSGRVWEEIDYRIPVSFHCPTDAVLWKRFPGIESAYDPRWEGFYYSDGGGSFRYGDPEDDRRPDELQICLHPDRWFAPDAHLDLPDDEFEAFFHHPKARP